MCEDVLEGCHTLEFWMPNSPLLLVTVGFLFLYLFIRFLARSIPAIGI